MFQPALSQAAVLVLGGEYSAFIRSMREGHGGVEHVGRSWFRHVGTHGVPLDNPAFAERPICSVNIPLAFLYRITCLVCRTVVLCEGCWIQTV